jgi:anti-sigma factor RsiW
MEHEALRENLSAFLDGELDPESKTGLEAHLKECEACRRELEGLKKASVRFREAGKVRAPAALGEAVLKKGRPERRHPALTFAVALAAIVLALYAAGRVFKPQLSQVFNQVMSMVSGAAQSVGSAK